MPEKSKEQIVDEFSAILPTLKEAIAMPAPFTGMVGATLANIPDDQWQRTMHQAQTPCGDIGCKCHIRMSNLYFKLDEIRDESKARVAARRG